MLEKIIVPSVQITLVSGDIDFYDGPMDTFDKYSQTMRKFDGPRQVNQHLQILMESSKELFDNIYEIAQTVSQLVVKVTQRKRLV